ncbi:DUF6785 family protein [Planctomycetota bacterium]
MARIEGGEATRCVTLRAVGVGLVVVAFLSYWIAYAEYVVRASRMNVSHFPMALFIVFAALTLGANAALRAVRREWALAEGEVVTVVAMGLVGAVAPASGISGFLLGNIGTPFYFASVENQWGQYLHRSIPAWLAPRDDLGAVTWFFEGLPEGQRAPWGVWAVPLLWWFALIGALAWMCACVSALLRQRWSAEERLSYPLLEPVRELSQEPERGVLAGVLRSRLFVVGAAVPLVFMAIEVIGWFWRGFPSIGLYRARYLHFLPGFPPINTKVNFYTIGFAYFANVEVLASVWVFYALFVVEGGVVNHLGTGLGPRGDAYGSYVFAGAGWQCFGAFIVFVLWGLWMARRRIREAVANAFRRGQERRGEEMLSDRVAVLGLLGGGAFVMLWLVHSGMSVGVAALLLVVSVLTYIGVARIVCQAGLVYVQAPLTAQCFTMYSLGTAGMSAGSLTALGFSYALISYNRGFLMPAMAHTAKLSETVGRQKGRLLAAAGAALAVGLALSVYYGLRLGYRDGAYHYGLPFTAGRFRDFPTIVEKLRNPFGPDWMRLSFFAAGAAVMTALMALRYRFAWWPLHPIGLAVCSTNVTLDSVLSIFIAWGVKTVILRVGGVGLYRRSRPFFIGLLVGQAAAVALAFAVDLIWFPGRGHQVHAW